MKQALVFGGGSKFGATLTLTLIRRGYHVHLVTSNPQAWSWDNVTTIPVDWHTVNLGELKNIIKDLPELDLIFFNHNASSLNSNKFKRGQLHDPRAWNQSYFVACQLPFYLVQALSNRINPNTRIGWMLSKLIVEPAEQYTGLVDYMGNKFTNACMIRAFAQNYPAVFFGVHPDNGVSQGGADQQAADGIVDIAEWPAERLNGHMFDTQGNPFFTG